jgi:beta-glucosidase
VEFTIRTGDLAFCIDAMQLVTEPGVFHVWIAPDSASGRRAEFTITD